MDLIIIILPVVTKDLPISPRFTRYGFLSQCPSVFLFRCVLHPLPWPLSSCLDCIPPLIGLPSLRFMRLLLVCFYCLCVFVGVFYFLFIFVSRRCPLLATFLSVLFFLLSLLISDFRFDLVWFFRLSFDHGWIRSGSVNNVR